MATRVHHPFPPTGACGFASIRSTVPSAIAVQLPEVGRFLVCDVSDCEYEYERAFECRDVDLPDMIAADAHFGASLSYFFEEDYGRKPTKKELIDYSCKSIDNRTNGIRVYPLADLFQGRYVKMRMGGNK